MDVSQDAIPFEFPPGMEPPPEPEEKRATITPKERMAFNRIFDEIATRGIKPTGPEGIRVHDPDPARALAAVNVLMQDAEARTYNKRRPAPGEEDFDPLSPLDQMRTARDREKTLLRFPPSLREAASRALGVLEADRERPINRFSITHDSESVAAFGTGPELVDVSDIVKPGPEGSQDTAINENLQMKLDPLGQSVEAEAARRVARLRVEEKMQKAKSDFELWDVLEKEVFPMVGKLGLLEEQLSIEHTKKRGGRKKKSEESKELLMDVHGPLYPSHLLTAIRLLDTSFGRSSPLALNILPRIKELGVASYVLGVSTPLYNYLASIYWKRYGDPIAVLDLLEEMRYAGLYTNEATYNLMLSIHEFFKTASGKQRNASWESGPFLKEVATLPVYQHGVQPRIKHWFNTITVHNAQRKALKQEEFRPKRTRHYAVA